MHARALARATARLAPAVVIVVALITGLSDVLRVVTILRGRTLLAFGGADGRLQLAHAPQFLQADLRPGATGTLADASLALRVTSALPSIIQVLVVMAAAVLLFGIVRRVATADVFAPAVVRRWGLLAAVLAGGGILQGLADTAAVTLIIARTDFDVPERARIAFLGGDYQVLGIDVPEWPIGLILIGVVAASLAVAFRSGAELERQTVGVI